MPITQKGIIDKLNTLRNILLLEKAQDYSDSAVIGGLDRFIGKLREDLNSPEGESSRTNLQKSDLFSSAYTDMTLQDRCKWAEKSLFYLEQVFNEQTSKQRARKKTPSKFNKLKTAYPSPNSKVSVLNGVGPGLAAKLKSIGVEKIVDFLYLYPRRYIPITSVSKLTPGEELGVLVNIWEVYQVKLGSRQSTRAVVGDETGNVVVMWFNQPFVAKSLKVNRKALIIGKANVFRGEKTLECSGYEFIESDDEIFEVGKLIPVYPSTEGLNQRAIRKVARVAVDSSLNVIDDYLPEAIRSRLKLLDLSDAMSSIHSPPTKELKDQARDRIAFDELFLTQLSLLSRKYSWQQEGSGRVMVLNSDLMTSFINLLPFQLTNGQQKSLSEISHDMSDGRPMSRLLQGEVGSGKTVVAAAAMLLAVVNGCVAAMMAPTEILAEQHFVTVGKLFGTMGKLLEEPDKFAIDIDGLSNPMRIGLLIGSMPKVRKDALKRSIEDGEIDIIIGTQALIQESVIAPRLGMVVVDEQHRFGVMQRQALREKGERPHLLVMSATPIPRTLALTLFGDVDISVIKELPKGRSKVKTKWVEQYQRNTGYAFIRKQVKEGRQAFVICPLIEESDALQAKAATREFKLLSTDVFSDLRLDLLHGRMHLDDKLLVMEKFRKGEIDILVSTPVIEVGVDVPNATVMLIEGADRFGLSALHQFRGRVGRGQYPGYCLLMSEDPSPEAQERFTILETTGDGFVVAEEDLRLRGPGAVLGTRQSGLPDLRLASLSDLDLLKLARKEAEVIMLEDPLLKSKEHRALAKKVKEQAQDESPEMS